jgi:RHS repeat-associated protein
VSATFDALERLASISDEAGLIARYEYRGPDRIERREYGNGTATTWEYDGAKRVVRTTHARAATPFDDRSYGWDPMYRKTAVTDLLADRATSFEYDSIYRLIESSTTPAAGPVETVSYAFDGAQNRTAVPAGPDAGAYTQDATAPAPADRQVNQYSQTPFDARRYDANGNLTALDAPAPATVVYDHRNRMVAYAAPGASGSYRYDALGRRIERRVNAETVRYFYAGARVCEEQGGDGTALATYVDGNGVDEHLSMRRGGQDVYSHEDELGSIAALSDAAGAVVERYRYGDYGLPAILDPDGAARAASAFDNPYLFTGRRFDPESRWYEYRTRYLDPRAGRFTTRDTIGMWGDPANLGNAFAYVGNSPATFDDPFGMQGGKRDPLGDLDWALYNRGLRNPSMRRTIIRDIRDNQRLREIIEQNSLDSKKLGDDRLSRAVELCKTKATEIKIDKFKEELQHNRKRNPYHPVYERQKYLEFLVGMYIISGGSRSSEAWWRYEPWPEIKPGSLGVPNISGGGKAVY